MQHIVFWVTGPSQPCLLVAPQEGACGVLLRYNVNFFEAGVFVKVERAIGNVKMLILFFRASFMTKTVPCGNELHKFLIWDTAGQERVSVRCSWLSGGKH